MRAQHTERPNEAGPAALGATRTAPRSFARRFATAWLGATFVGAALGGLLAAVAIARAQYPVLDGAGRLVLAAHWAGAGAASGAIAGLPLGALAAAIGWPGAAVGTLGAAVLAAASVATRGGATRAEAGSASPSASIAAGGVGSQAARPNLVLFTIDTLRADHLEVYGYHRTTAPALARLAARGVLFETAIAQAPATQLSMASLLTGLWPWSHQDPAQPRPEWAPFLRSGFHTLAERLAAAGFDTGGFVANPVLRSAQGYAQGFAHFDEGPAVADADAAQLLEPALSWLANAREPFFLWVHAMDPHHPYDAPELAPWERLDDRSARLRAEWRALPLAAMTDRLLGVRKGRALRDGELAMLIDRYDAEIRHVDRALARLLEALERRGADPADTWIVVTADHGEEFQDHGAMMHGHTLLDELLHVPLVVRAPGAPAGLRVATTVRGIDVAATLSDAGGVPAADLDGRSLAPLWTAPDGGEDRPALASREGKYVAYRTRESKLVVPAAAPAPVAPPARGIEALRWMARVAFDGAFRPKCGYWSLAQEEPAVPRFAPGERGAALEAQAELASLRSREPARVVPFDAPARLDADVEARLRALGYVE